MPEPSGNRDFNEAIPTDRIGSASSATMADPTVPAPLLRVGTEKELRNASHVEQDGFDNHQYERALFSTSESEATCSEGNNGAETKSTTSSQQRQPRESQKEKSFWVKVNPFKWNPPPVPKERMISREHSANFFSLLTFQWMAPMMTTGYKRTLELGDIWLVNPARGSDALVAKMQASFKVRYERGDKHPLIWSIFDTFRREISVGGICQLTSSVVQVMSPFMLKYLINFADEAYAAQQNGVPGPPLSHGIGLVIGITLLQTIQSFGTNHFIYEGMIVGGQSRAVLISAIFEKAMKISNRAKAGGSKSVEEQRKVLEDAKTAAEMEVKEKMRKMSEWKNLLRKNPALIGARATPDQWKRVSGDGTSWASARIINLMSVDTYRIDQASGMFHLTWTAPISISITLVLLLINLTYSALAGFGLIVIGVPLLSTAIKSLFRRRTKINKVTDQRVWLTQEILAAVRFVKYFGWEKSFLQQLDEIRKREIRGIQVLMAIRNAINAVLMSMPIFASMLSFICFSLTNHGLNPAQVFSSLALFNALSTPLNMLPFVIGQVIDASASLDRIQEFLTAEEQEEDIIWAPEGQSALEVRDSDFTWERMANQAIDHSDMPKAKQQPKDGKQAEKNERMTSKEAEKLAQVTKENASELAQLEPFKLHEINLNAGRNELLAVIGNVGSGKTSLLAALAGDMRKTAGEVQLGAKRAFCPQYAWIQNATLQQNLRFGKPHEEDWYNCVIDACALRPDLEMLPNGDMTEIGERGITVSGGQKQRLNIARAIYFNADIVLMDDPLSAVDAHVGRHIMDHAICGLLKDKCRILATHQLHVLSRCDRVIWMHEGRIKTIDTFDYLMKHHEGFQKLMKTTSQEGKGVEEKQAVGEDDEVQEEKKEAKKSKSSKKGAALMTQEEQAVDAVGWRVYKAYTSASGSPFNALIVFSLLVLSQGANITTSLWLSFWTSNKFNFSNGQYIGIYAILGTTQALLMFAFATSLSIFGTTASKVMLQGALSRVLRAPMSFFDTTPLGRITNRFSKDIDTMDNNLTDNMRMYFLTLALLISIFALITAFFHYFAIALGPLIVVIIFAASYYRASARELKRHEAVLRSTVFARFSEGISGTACIRAYGLEAQFAKGIRQATDQMNSAYFLTFSNQRWLSVRLDAVGITLVFTTGILVVTSRFSVSPSIGGLVLSYVLSIVQMIQFAVRQLAELENAMNSTERIHHYGTALDEEAPLSLNPVRPTWPERGALTFSNV